MAQLTFTKSNQSKEWEATISGVTGTILVDLERDKKGNISVWGKIQGATSEKFLGLVERGMYDKNVLFAVANDSDSGAMDVTIKSGSQVTAGKYA